MYRDEDLLLRAIRRLAEAVGRWASGARSEVDDALREATGLSLVTLDRLPANTLIATFGVSDDIGRARLAAIAEVLETTASEGAGRADKAAALRAALT
jgi:hypothetical protein